MLSSLALIMSSLINGRKRKTASKKPVSTHYPISVLLEEKKPAKKPAKKTKPSTAQEHMPHTTRTCDLCSESARAQVSMEGRDMALCTSCFWRAVNGHKNFKSIAWLCCGKK